MIFPYFKIKIIRINYYVMKLNNKIYQYYFYIFMNRFVYVYVIVNKCNEM